MIKVRFHGCHCPRQHPIGQLGLRLRLWIFYNHLPDLLYPIFVKSGNWNCECKPRFQPQLLRCEGWQCRDTALSSAPHVKGTPDTSPAHTSPGSARLQPVTFPPSSRAGARRSRGAPVQVAPLCLHHILYPRLSLPFLSISVDDLCCAQHKSSPVIVCRENLARGRRRTVWVCGCGVLLFHR